MSDRKNDKKMIYILPDSMLTVDEMFKSWTIVAEHLRHRARRAERAHRLDASDKKKNDRYLNYSREYYSFTALLSGYDVMSQKFVKIYEESSGVSSLRAPLFERPNPGSN